MAPVEAQRPARLGLRSATTPMHAACAMASTLTFGVAVPVFSRLESTIRNKVIELGLDLAAGLPVEGISCWLIGTPVVFYVTSLLVLHFPMRAETRTES